MSKRSGDAMTARLPNLFIIGASKCGTTSLFTYLNSHPEFQGSRIKETDYFVPSKFDETKVNLEEYAKYFDSDSTARFVFEASTSYINGKARLARYLKMTFPGCKVIVLLRDPVDRAFSQFKFSKDLLLIDKRMTFTAYIDACEEAARTRPPTEIGMWHALTRTYAETLPGWMETLGDDLWVGFFEDMKADAMAFTDEICAWLGAAPASQSGVVFSVENPSIIPANATLHRAARKVADAFETTLRGNPWLKRNLRQIYHRLNRSKISDPKPTAAERARLEAYFAPSNALLRAAFAEHRPSQTLPVWLR